jgi:hypothetical protein
MIHLARRLPQLTAQQEEPRSIATTCAVAAPPPAAPSGTPKPAPWPGGTETTFLEVAPHDRRPLLRPDAELGLADEGARRRRRRSC